MEKIIFTGGNYLKLKEEPEWSDFHQRYYAASYRWIKSKRKFSANCLLHNFKQFEVVDEISN